MFSKLKEDNKVVGTKQVKRALVKNQAKVVFIAKDAESKVITDLIKMAQTKLIDVIYIDNMRKLGKACGIDVNAAAAALLK